MARGNGNGPDTLQVIIISALATGFVIIMNKMGVVEAIEDMVKKWQRMV